MYPFIYCALLFLATYIVILIVSASAADDFCWLMFDLHVQIRIRMIEMVSKGLATLEVRSSAKAFVIVICMVFCPKFSSLHPTCDHVIDEMRSWLIFHSIYLASGSLRISL